MSESLFLKIPVLSVLPIGMVAGCGGARQQPWTHVSDPLVPPAIDETDPGSSGLSGEAMARIRAAQQTRAQRLCQERSTCEAQYFARNYGSLDACFHSEMANTYAVYDAYNLDEPDCVNAIVSRIQCLTDSTSCSRYAYYAHVYQDYSCHNRFQSDIDRACFGYDGYYNGTGYFGP